jgi:catechol 2,3-dioxygenase-like lactoylglutathione lyase family enzyme
MKRLHVHMSVGDLEQSIRFYSTLFAAAPTVVKPDYAKWMLEDPRVNFAISTHADGAPGIDHLGIQVEDGEELQEIYGRLKDAAGAVLEEGKTTCCYAQSEKAGPSIRRACRGRPSSPPARARSTARARPASRS